MSRIGKQPVPIPAGVTVKLEGRTVSVQGPKGNLTYTWRPEVAVSIDDDRRRPLFIVEQTSRQGTKAKPQKQRARNEGGCSEAANQSSRLKPRAPSLEPSRQPHAPGRKHHLISSTVAAARPFTSGAYISSAIVPAARNVPVVVARTR